MQVGTREKNTWKEPRNVLAQPNQARVVEVLDPRGWLLPWRFQCQGGPVGPSRRSKRAAESEQSTTTTSFSIPSPSHPAVSTTTQETCASHPARRCATAGLKVVNAIACACLLLRCAPSHSPTRVASQKTGRYQAKKPGCCGPANPYPLPTFPVCLPQACAALSSDYRGTPPARAAESQSQQNTRESRLRATQASIFHPPALLCPSPLPLLLCFCCFLYCDNP